MCRDIRVMRTLTHVYMHVCMRVYVYVSMYVSMLRDGGEEAGHTYIDTNVQQQRDSVIRNCLQEMLVFRIILEISSILVVFYI